MSDVRSEAIPNPLYKGVGTLRLKADLAEDALPIGIRPGSATALAIANGSRKATELDKTTLWFGEQDDAIEYCKKQSQSILLRIDLTGYQVTRSGQSYYTTVPVAWERVTYLRDDGTYGPLSKGAKVPPDAKDLSDD